MVVIHFTNNAADPLGGFKAFGARFVPLADGTGDTHVSCLHLEEGGSIIAPSITHAAILLIVHGRVIVTTEVGARINFSAGTGAVFGAAEPYTLESPTGSILLIVEAQQLAPHQRGISSPQRIAGATWPSDALLMTVDP